MNKTHYLIIGGGIAGTTAAETIRFHDKVNKITIISDEPYELYSRIMLSKPNFFLEKIPFDHIWLKNNTWYKQKNILLLKNKTAIKLDTNKKCITLNDDSKIFYTKLLISIGSHARKWNVPGSEKRGVLYLRNLNDARSVIARVKEIKNAICIGSGFISFEMCDMLKLAKKNVFLVILELYYWYPILDEASGKIIEDVLLKNNIKIFHNAEVKEIIGKNSVQGVILKDNTHLECEMIMAGIGVYTPLEWLKQASVLTNRGVLTNEYLETNIPDIWSAGDSTEFKDTILDEQIQLGNWVNAQVQGKIAGLNMVGKKQAYHMVSFYTTQGFGYSIAFVGDIRPLPEREMVIRQYPEKKCRIKILVKDDEPIGATLVNRTQDIGALTKLIEKNVKVSSIRKQLEDTNIDLNKLI